MTPARYLTFLVSLPFFVATLQAQPKTDKVSKLLAAENYFAALAKEKGIRKAYLTVSDENSLLFKPHPVKAIEFFKDQSEDGGVLSWQPAYARITKSNDWGFTSGPYTFRETDTSKNIAYGDYLSVWKKNKKGIWKLALNLDISHPKPVKIPRLEFINPTDERFVHQYGSARLQQRQDIILSSDQLYATILKADNKIAHNEFLSDETRLLFPGFQPMHGKAEVMNFLEKQKFTLSSQPKQGDRAFSGELAYTIGEASTELTNKIRKYHYVRIWEIQPGFNWEVIFQAFVEKE